MSTASAGRQREHRVRDLLVEAGYPFIMRAAASKGPGDLLHGHPVRGAFLVQVGTHNKTLGPDDRERFCTAAELVCAVPLLAVVTAGIRGARFYWVTRDKPSTWDEVPIVCQVTVYKPGRRPCCLPVADFSEFCEKHQADATRLRDLAAGGQR